MAVVYVFLGGGLGSIVRYYLSILNADKIGTSWPLGTLLANLASCFILGILMQKVFNNQIHPSATLLLATGFCGGFSTFSTFSYELYLFFQKGELLPGIIYVGLSLVLGILLMVLGMKIIK